MVSFWFRARRSGVPVTFYYYLICAFREGKRSANALASLHFTVGRFQQAPATNNHDQQQRVVALHFVHI